MTMRERLARALVSEFNRQANEEIGYVSDLNGKEWFLDGLFDIVKGIDAILAEMETPSEDMIDWGGREIGFQVQKFGGAKTMRHYSSPEVEEQNQWIADLSYRAMIRAIREGK